MTKPHSLVDKTSRKPNPPETYHLDADNGALAGDVGGFGGFGSVDTGGKGSNGGEAAAPSAGDAPDSTSPTGDDDAGRQDWKARFDDWIDEKGELAALRAAGDDLHGGRTRRRQTRQGRGAGMTPAELERCAAYIRDLRRWAK